ncbi:MAG: hypothetical protein IPJ98_08890 [Bryobacterales bacterium]|nr:hypothetical protein [Bryobacterales bacterium]
MEVCPVKRSVLARPVAIVENWRKQEAARKLLRDSLPPEYRRQSPLRRRKPYAWTGTIGRIPQQDKP